MCQVTRPHETHPHTSEPYTRDEIAAMRKRLVLDTGREVDHSQIRTLATIDALTPPPRDPREDVTLSPDGCFEVIGTWSGDCWDDIGVRATDPSEFYAPADFPSEDQAEAWLRGER